MIFKQLHYFFLNLDKIMSKSKKKFKMFQIKAKGINEIIVSKKFALDMYEDLRQIKMYFNEPGIITLEGKNENNSWELLNKTTINKDFFDNNKPIGYKK